MDSEVSVHTHSPPHVDKVIGIPSYDYPDKYTVLLSNSSIAEYSDTNNILEAAPEKLLAPLPTLLPYWVQDGANDTLFLSTMSKP